MSDITMDEISVVVSGSSDKATDSFERLISALDKLEGSVSTAFNGLKNANNKLNNTTKSVNKIKDVFKSATSGLAKFGLSLGITNVSTSAALSSAIEYTQVYAGFNKVLGTSQKNLERATKFVDDLTDSWYLDKQQVMQATSRYYNMTKTMGMTEDVAFNMSKNLTMLSYDLQLLGTTGATVTEVQNQIASALRGEAEGLAKFGISLNQATLQTILYEKGINRTVSSLTAAQKAELIYYQIMRQTYSKHGYYAEQLGKDVLNPAIAVRALKNQFLNLARAIGSVFIPILSALAPYIIAITQLITQLANTIAGLLGFELGDWGVNSDEISAGFGDIGDSAEQAGKKVKGALGDFDELHTISFPNASGAAGMGAGGSLGLDASEFEYGAEWLEVTNEKLERAKKLLYDIKDYLITIGLVIAGYKVSSSILNFLKNWGVLSDKTNILKASIGIGLTIGSAYLLYKGIQKLIDGDINATSIAETAFGLFGLTAGIITTVRGLGYKIGIGKGIAVSAAVSLLITGFEVYKQGIEEKNLIKTILGSLFVGVATGIAVTILTGMPILGIAAGLMVALTLFGITVDTSDSGKKIMRDHGKTWGYEISEGTVQGFNETNGNISSSVSQYWQRLTTETDGELNELQNVIGTNFTSAKEKATTQLNSLETQNSNTLDSMNSKTAIAVGDMVTTIDTNFLKANLSSSLNLREMKNNTTDSFTEIETTSKEKFEKMTSNISDKMSKAENSFNISAKNMSKSIETATKDMDTNTAKWKGMLERGNQAKIKSPSFSWKETINSALTSTLKNVLLALGLPIALPTMAISWVSGAYAEGGFPNAGDLFIANEAGAEWVGSMNGRTAVANNDQISKGVEEASYRGMARALQEYGYAGVTVINKLDSKEIASKTTKVIRSNANMYG